MPQKSAHGVRPVFIFALVVVLGACGGVVAMFPERMMLWLVGAVVTIWGSFFFIAYLLIKFLQQPWGIREKRLAELEAENTVYRTVFDATLKVGKAASDAGTLERGLQASVETLGGELSLDGCSLWAYNPFNEKLENVAGCGYRSDNVKPMPLSARDGVAGKAIQERRAIFVSDASEEREFVQPGPKGAKVKALFCIPLVEHGKVVGVLSGSTRKPRTFSTFEKSVLDLIAARLTSLMNILVMSEASRTTPPTQESGVQDA